MYARFARLRTFVSRAGYTLRGRKRRRGGGGEKRAASNCHSLCFTMTLRGNREKYRFCSNDIGNGIKKKKKRSRDRPRGRHTKNVAEKIAATRVPLSTLKLSRVEFAENYSARIQL
ncbi:hypothetical protein PUN28_009536 [Cardiocondyla obscurior]|uniref:Uncharacterized protein n=1 Tax=Cardiocondyla obscurior TaxID=286306 RepID=A0AAW2FSM7_9HYME